MSSGTTGTREYLREISSGKIMKTILKLRIVFIFLPAIAYSQSPDIKTKINSAELNMTFPGIYFKHNSTDYAEMPYTVDSCFKYIRANRKYINSRPIWRDSSETEQLTKERIQKLKTDLGKYPGSEKIEIRSMNGKQKISQRTIYSGTDSLQIQYLLSLNSVFDVAGARVPKAHKAWRLPCWMNLQLNRAGRKRCKMERRAEYACK